MAELLGCANLVMGRLKASPSATVIELALGKKGKKKEVRSQPTLLPRLIPSRRGGPNALVLQLIVPVLQVTIEEALLQIVAPHFPAVAVSEPPPPEPLKAGAKLQFLNRPLPPCVCPQPFRVSRLSGFSQPFTPSPGALSPHLSSAPPCLPPRPFSPAPRRSSHSTAEACCFAAHRWHCRGSTSGQPSCFKGYFQDPKVVYNRNVFPSAPVHLLVAALLIFIARVVVFGRRGVGGAPGGILVWDLSPRPHSPQHRLAA